MQHAAPVWSIHAKAARAIASLDALALHRLRAWSRRVFGVLCPLASSVTEEVDARVDPLDPANKLIFATGPLTGTMAPTGGRYAVVTKGALTGAIVYTLQQAHDDGEAFRREREDDIDKFLLGLLACLREMPSPGKLGGQHLHYTHEETCSALDLRGVRGVRACRLRRCEPRSIRARPTAPGGVVPQGRARFEAAGRARGAARARGAIGRGPRRSVRFPPVSGLTLARASRLCRARKRGNILSGVRPASRGRLVHPRSS